MVLVRFREMEKDVTPLQAEKIHKMSKSLRSSIESLNNVNPYSKRGQDLRLKIFQKEQKLLEVFK